MTPPERQPATIRPAVPQDADGIALTFLESAAHHARLDAERYGVPVFDAISARYREGKQHPSDANAPSVTLVADIGGQVLGFVDARIERSPDPMHREMTFCHVVEIAVRESYRSQGVGALLLQTVEDWGRRQGAAFASLEYLVANTRAAAFYQRTMGYQPTAVVALKRL